MGMEWCKIRRNKLQVILIIIIPLLINALLTFDLHFRYSYLLAQKEEINFTYWQLIFKEQNIFMINELLAVFCTLFVFLIFFVEIRYHGWFYVKMSKKSMASILCQKYALVLLFMTILILLNCLSLIPVGIITGVKTPIEWGLFAKVFVAQWIMAIGVTAINFLVVAVIPKIVYLIPISCVLFLITSMVQKIDGFIFNEINPYAFAASCYTQSGKDIIIHTCASLIWMIVCIIMSTRILERRDELV